MDSYGYDEDISENRFFLALQHKATELYDAATSNRWIVCIPCTASLGKYAYNSEDFMNHILQPCSSSDSNVYKTLSDKEVTIQSNAVTTGHGFSEIRTAHILFEETFFNKNDKSYRVLCLDILLEGGSIESAVPLNITVLQTFEDCTELLFGHTDTDRTEKQISRVIDLFNDSYRSDVQSLRHHIDVTHTLFTKAVQIVLKDSYLKTTARHNKVYMDNIKVAVETHVLHHVYKKVFKGISTCTAVQDARLNKITRNLADLQLKDLQIKPELSKSIPRARLELSNLVKFTTPLGKLSCLKRSIAVMMHPSKTNPNPDADMAITSDDILPVLVFLVIKTDIPNWLAHFNYMTKFRFSASNSDDEYSFYLASIEAAIEYVKSGQLKKNRLGHSSQSWQMNSLSRQLSSDSPGGTSSIDSFFQHIQDGNCAHIQKMLAANQMKAEDIKLQLCHPLCSCDRCEKLLAKTRNDDAAVTVFSRDDRGFTVLHVAALYGQAEALTILIEKGAVVNATDYHGSTPLHLACQKGHLNVTLILLHYGGDINMTDNDGNTSLHLCTANGHEECVHALIFNQANVKLDINAGNDFADTPLHLAAKWGYVEIVDELLAQGASVEARNRRKLTPLMCSHNIQVSQLLMTAVKKAEEERLDFVNVDTPAASSPPTASANNAASSRATTSSETEEQKVKSKALGKLFKAIGDGDSEMVKFHLGWGEDLEDDLDIDLSDQQLCHPLCQCNKCAPMQKLTSSSPSGIHVNSTNLDDVSALHVAARCGEVALVELFLKRGANVDTKTKSAEQTPLHVACHYNKPQVVSCLLEHNAKVNVKDSQGRSPLHYCCMNGAERAAVLLIQHGANVNQPNHKGNTSLHEAAKYNFLNLVELLLQYGANVDCRNRQNLISLQLTNNDDIVQILDEAAKRKNSTENFPNANELSNSPKQSMPQISPTKILRKQPSIQDISGENLRDKQLKQLQNIAHSIQNFDRRQSLKRTVTTDRSSPRIDRQLLHQLMIQHFDQKRLRHIQRHVQSVLTETGSTDDSVPNCMDNSCISDKSQIEGQMQFSNSTASRESENEETGNSEPKSDDNHITKRLYFEEENQVESISESSKINKSTMDSFCKEFQDSPSCNTSVNDQYFEPELTGTEINLKCSVDVLCDTVQNHVMGDAKEALPTGRSNDSIHSDEVHENSNTESCEDDN